MLAIDPGSLQSGWILLDNERVVASGVTLNPELLRTLVLSDHAYQILVCEFMSPRGLPTSREDMETIWWAGRFAQAAQPRESWRVTRDDVKLHLCGRRSKVTDANVRQALIDRYGGIGGKAAAIGTKAAPGPLHGVSTHAWAALAVGLTWLDRPDLRR
ncbi:MAG: hypothetical protein U0838_12880 [Chloroflexota bacterium]